MEIKLCISMIVVWKQIMTEENKGIIEKEKQTRLVRRKMTEELILADLLQRNQGLRVAV